MLLGKVLILFDTVKFLLSFHVRKYLFTFEQNSFNYKHKPAITIYFLLYGPGNTKPIS